MAKAAGKVDRLRELREARAVEVEASPFAKHSAQVRDAIQRGRAAFEDLGAALRSCKESASWRERYTSWAEACEAEWGISKRHANRLIEGVRVMDMIGVGPTGPTSKNGVEASAPKSLPTNERAAREFAGVPEDKIPEVAKRAAELANGGPPTSTHVHQAKQEVIPEPEDYEPDPYEELEGALRENRRLSEVVSQITDSDAAVELAKASERYARLEGRVSQLAQTAKQAENTAKYATGVLRKVRKALGVEKDAEILPAIARLRV